MAAFYESLSTVGPSCLDELDELFAPDVHYISPVEESTRLEQIRHGFRAMFQKYPHVRFSDIKMMGDDQEFLGVWTMELGPRIGPTFRVRCASEFRARDGKVYFFRDYWDLLTALAETVPGLAPLYLRVAHAIFA